MLPLSQYARRPKAPSLSPSTITTIDDFEGCDDITPTQIVEFNSKDPKADQSNWDYFNDFGGRGATSIGFRTKPSIDPNFGRRVKPLGDNNSSSSVSFSSRGSVSLPDESALARLKEKMKSTCVSSSYSSPRSGVSPRVESNSITSGSGPLFEKLPSRRCTNAVRPLFRCSARRKIGVEFDDEDQPYNRCMEIRRTRSLGILGAGLDCSNNSITPFVEFG